MQRGHIITPRRRSKSALETGGIMLLDRRTLAASLALALLAAACGGGTTATTAPGGTAQASQAPAPTDDGSGPAVSLVPGTASELEAMLPSDVNGITFTKTSFGGGTLPGTIPVGSDELGTFLQANGKTLADVSFAMATPTDPSKAGTTFVMAFQVKGVDGTKLAEVLGGTSGSDLQPATVSGKQVQQSGAAGMGFTLYIKGDVVFYILAIGDASLTEGIVAALP
jgi:hypothetical protein